jgi:RNA polymerase sigma-54 factor
MKATLQLKQAQHLQMTPQLQQAIRLLQLSTVEIAEETSRLLDQNPFLEREDDAPVGYAPPAAATPATPDSAETFESDWSEAPYEIGRAHV